MIAYVVQPEALGLCDAIFRALPLIRPDESALVGLPDTIWLPEEALAALPDNKLAFLTFPVARPEFFERGLLTRMVGSGKFKSSHRALRRGGFGRVPAARCGFTRAISALGNARAP